MGCLEFSPGLYAQIENIPSSSSILSKAFSSPNYLAGRDIPFSHKVGQTELCEWSLQLSVHCGEQGTHPGYCRSGTEGKAVPTASVADQLEMVGVYLVIEGRERKISLFHSLRGCTCGAASVLLVRDECQNPLSVQG